MPRGYSALVALSQINSTFSDNPLGWALGFRWFKKLEDVVNDILSQLVPRQWIVKRLLCFKHCCTLFDQITILQPVLQPQTQMAANYKTSAVIGATVHLSIKLYRIFVRLYSALVWPHLEYVMQANCPYLKKRHKPPRMGSNKVGEGP